MPRAPSCSMPGSTRPARLRCSRRSRQHRAELAARRALPGQPPLAPPRRYGGVPADLGLGGARRSPDGVQVLEAGRPAATGTRAGFVSQRGVLPGRRRHGRPDRRPARATACTRSSRCARCRGCSPRRGSSTSSTAWRCPTSSGSRRSSPHPPTARRPRTSGTATTIGDRGRWAQRLARDRVTVVVVDDADRDYLFRTFESLLALPTGLLVPDPELSGEQPFDDGSRGRDVAAGQRRGRQALGLAAVREARAAWGDPADGRVAQPGVRRGAARHPALGHRAGPGGRAGRPPRGSARSASSCTATCPASGIRSRPAIRRPMHCSCRCGPPRRPSSGRSPGRWPASRSRRRRPRHQQARPAGGAAADHPGRRRPARELRRAARQWRMAKLRR